MTIHKCVCNLSAVRIAIIFHETYERLAPKFGYETRKETKVFDASSPNGKLMIEVCREMRDYIADKCVCGKGKV